MCIICNILCCAIAISNFDSETCNTPPKRLWKDRAGKKCQDLRQCTLKVPCRCTKQWNHNLSALEFGLASPGT